MPDESQDLPANDDAPTSDDLRLIEEAEALRDYITKMVRLMAARVRRRVESGYSEITTFRGVDISSSPAEQKAHALAMVGQLRHLRAVLRGAEDNARLEERWLVTTISAFEPRWRELQLVALNSWRIDAKKPPVAFDVETPEGATETFLAMADEELSDATVKVLRGAKGRALVHQAISIRAGFARAPATDSKAPRWLIPLFVVALDAGIAMSDSQDAHGWYKSLSRRGIWRARPYAKGKNRG